MTAVNTRITSRGVIQEAVPGSPPGDSKFIVEVTTVGLNTGAADTVTWAPFASAGELSANGWYSSWSDAVAAVQALKTPVTFLQIEADPWHDEVVLPAGSWTLNNTVLVGKVGYAQGGRDWVASRDYGNQSLNQGWQYYNQQYRGHQVKLWVHAEANDVNPTKIHGCIGLKDMFFRGYDADTGLTFSDVTYYGFVDDPYNPGSTGTCYISVGSGGSNTFSEADLFTDINNDEQSWYVTIIEVISPTLVKVDTQGYPNWLVNAEGGTVANQTVYTENGDRNNATFDLIGRMGGKESYFSGYNSEFGTSRFYTRNIDRGSPSSSDNYFNQSLVGKKIYVSNIGEYSGEYTVIKYWNSNEVEIDLPHNLTGGEGSEADYGSGNAYVNWTTMDSYHTDSFVLDNVDLRSPYGNFGSINLRCGNMTLLLTGFETSIRNGESITTDGLLVIQSDGSPAWMGGYSVGTYNGDGYLKIYALPGMNLNTNWLEGYSSIDFDIYQGNIPYIPNNYGNWSGTRPYSVAEALNRLAAAVVAAGYTP